MANEIIKLGGDGGVNANLLFLYPIVSPITYPDQNSAPITIVPSPSSELTTMELNILTTAEKVSLDGGTLAFERVTMLVADSKTNAQLLADAQALYALKFAAYIAKLNRAYNRAGQRFNA